MKKTVFCIIPLIMVIMGCVSGGTATKGGSHGMDLDTAIREAAVQMEINLPGGTQIALVSVASSSTQLSEYVIGRLEAALVSGKKLVVVDRANLDRIREEQGFQLSGEVDDNSAKSIGRLLGAGAIVTGSFINMGDVYGLNLKAINMETAAIAVSYPADIAKSSRIETLLAGGGGAAGTQTAKKGATGGNATVPAAPALAAPAYKIGDTGPAGGLVFYDKGNNSGGWRYLEAAPVDIDRKLYAASEYIEFTVERNAGQGMANTQAIMVQANNRGGGFGWAAQACDALEVNGFDDWFLPSRDELHYMYGNLHMRNIGSFSLDWYWSSTFINGIWEYYDGWRTSGCWGENFSNGEQKYFGYLSQFRVRAVRRF